MRTYTYYPPVEGATQWTVWCLGSDGLARHFPPDAAINGRTTVVLEVPNEGEAARIANFFAEKYGGTAARREWKEALMYAPIQAFINRIQAQHAKSDNYEWSKAHELMINLATRHQQTYGEGEMEEFVGLLDGMSARVADESQYASKLIKEQANDMQERLRIRLMAEAVLQER